MNVNPLLCSPSPRDYPEVYEALKKTGYARLYAKYFPEKIAYNLLRDWFLDHEEYTHMVICPDDLIIEKEHVDTLIADLKEYDFPVLAGVCNVDMAKNKDYLCITENLPHPQRVVPERKQIGWRFYAWVHKDTKFPAPIVQVPFSGFACQFIRRDIVKKYHFADDAKYNGTPELITGAIDVMFSNVCAIERIPLMIDTRVRMKHLKGGQRFFDIILGDGELRFYHPRKDSFEKVYEEAKGKERTWRMTGGDVVEGIVIDKEQ